jgi:hypothetical protein
MLTPHRRTFATGILPFAHSVLTSLRHPACACQQRRLPGHEHPLAFPALVEGRVGVARALERAMEASAAMNGSSLLRAAHPRLRRRKRRPLPTGGRQAERGHGWRLHLWFSPRQAASPDATPPSDRRSASGAGPWMAASLVVQPTSGCVAGCDAPFRPEVGKRSGAMDGPLRAQMDGPLRVQIEKGPRLGKPRAQVAAIDVWVFGGGNSR